MSEIFKYYGVRFKRIFTFTSSKWYYVLAKIFLIIVGLPLHVALIPLDFASFLLYAIFSWIPYVSLFFLFITRILTMLCSVGYIIAVLPDLKRFTLEDDAEAEKQELISQSSEDATPQQYKED